MGADTKKSTSKQDKTSRRAKPGESSSNTPEVRQRPRQWQQHVRDAQREQRERLGLNMRASGVAQTEGGSSVRFGKLVK